MTRYLLPFAVLALSIVTAQSSFAQDADAPLGAAPSPPDTNGPIELTAEQFYYIRLIQARTLLERGELEKARQAIDAAIADFPSDSAMRALSGIIHMRQDQPGRAMIALRRALDLAQNPQDKSIARALLRQAQAQSPWRVSGTFGLIPSTNINGGTENAVSFWNGIEGTITGRDVQSGIGAQANTTVTYVAREPDGKDMQFSLGFTVRRYRDAAELNSRVLTGGVTRNWPDSSGSNAVSVRNVMNWHKGVDTRNNRFVETRTLQYSRRQKLPQPYHHLQFVLGRDWAQNMVVADRSSITNRTALTYSRAISKALRWSFGVSAADKDAVAADTANRTRGINLGLTHVWDSGWMVSGNLGGTDGLWDQVEFASGSSTTSGDQSRVDRTETLTVSTQKQQYQRLWPDPRV